MLNLRLEKVVVMTMEVQILGCQEKLLSLIMLVPVLQTDTGGQGEKPKAYRLTLVKELCKMAP